jgi:Fuc2NAc and GlcNAc transferase
MTLLLLSSGLALAALITGALRRHAIAARLLDIPNARSSHSVPTPRGGGIGIVATFTLLTLWLAWRGEVGIPFATALLGSGLAVALVGFIDDLGHVNSRVRLLCHLVAAAWALVWLGGVPPFPVLGVTADLGWAAQALGLLYLVGLLNFFNFMDGIDGIAGLEAIVVSLGGALVWWLATGTALWIVPALFAACVAGFLVWNFPPARIFMGDAGSGFIGITLGVMSIRAGIDAPPVYWSWFILLGCFIVDPTVTLVRRMRRGGRFDQAHRSHAYQYAARRLGSHRPVTLAYALITALWLLPVAVAVASGWIDGVAGAVVAYAPLIWLSFRYKAGAAELQESNVDENPATVGGLKG